MNKLFFSLTLLTITVLGCHNQTTEHSIPGVVKIVKTKVYNAKQNFDQLVTDSPAWNLGWEKSLGMEFSWNIIHYDKFGNALLQEDYNLDKLKEGKEEIYRRHTYSYYNAKERKYSSIKENWNIGSLSYASEEIFVRENNGNLLEKNKTVNGSLTRKVKYTYNSHGQQIRKEEFLENGLSETWEYVYASISSKHGEQIKEIHEVLGPKSYTEQIDYIRDTFKRAIKIRKRLFDYGKILSDVTTTVLNFHGEQLTKMVIEGFDETTGPDEPFKIVVSTKLNAKGNIEEYKSEFNYLKTSSTFRLPIHPEIHVCEYTYNEKGDWIQIIFRPTPKNCYIVKRDITYYE